MLHAGLIGFPSSGKTTLLRLLGGLRTPSLGQVHLDGQDLGKSPRKTLARQIAMVPQETHMAFDYSVLEVALMGRYPHHGTFGMEGADDLGYAADALAATGTTALGTRSFMTLSGGEKQRVVIASALTQLSGPSHQHGATQLLLLDEPTASLDLAYQLETARLVQKLNRDGVTIVVSTHDLNFAASLCKDLVLLRNGHVIAAGATNDVLTASNVLKLYGVEAEVTHNEAAGHKLVVPVSRNQ